MLCIKNKGVYLLHNNKHIVMSNTVNKSEIFKSAHRMFKSGYGSFSYCLSVAWGTEKKAAKTSMVVLGQFINNLTRQNSSGEYTEAIETYKRVLSEKQNAPAPAVAVKNVIHSDLEKDAIVKFYSK